MGWLMTDYERGYNKGSKPLLDPSYEQMFKSLAKKQRGDQDNADDGSVSG